MSGLVGRRIVTRPWFEPKSGNMGFVVDKMAFGQVFLQELLFPLPIFIPPTTPHLSSITRGWYNRPISGRRTKWTQSHPPTKGTKKKKNSFWACALISVNCMSHVTCIPAHGQPNNVRQLSALGLYRSNVEQSCKC
jgi:hypothetical protein